MNHRPVAVGLLLCDLVIVDEKTRNLTPVNCFSARKLDHFPGVSDFYLVAWLADGLGEMPVEIVIRRLDTLDEVYRIERQLRFEDPLKDMRFIARIRDCEIPVAGYYEVSLIVDGESIAHRKIFWH
ncbi:MAG TPA: hypothetical protein VFE62_03755 [Gemmataceae bacterium]|nr:hypothetical protein [Gemmataceae bacterium]